MSVSIGVALESGDVPDTVVPADQKSYGQNVVRYFSRLADVAEQRGVLRLEEFIIYREQLVMEALHAAGWQPPDPPAEWGDNIPIDNRYLEWTRTDPVYQAALAEEERIVAQVDRDLPWHDPAAGLATVRALITALETDPALDRDCYGAVWDLRAFRYELEYAQRIGTRFYFWAAY